MTEYFSASRCGMIKVTKIPLRITEIMWDNNVHKYYRQFFSDHGMAYGKGYQIQSFYIRDKNMIKTHGHKIFYYVLLSHENTALARLFDYEAKLGTFEKLMINYDHEKIKEVEK